MFFPSFQFYHSHSVWCLCFAYKFSFFFFHLHLFKRHTYFVFFFFGSECLIILDVFQSDEFVLFLKFRFTHKIYVHSAVNCDKYETKHTLNIQWEKWFKGGYRSENKILYTICRNILTSVKKTIIFLFLCDKAQSQ